MRIERLTGSNSVRYLERQIHIYINMYMPVARRLGRPLEGAILRTNSRRLNLGQLLNVSDDVRPSCQIGVVIGP